MARLYKLTGTDLSIFARAVHLDRSVSTGIPQKLYTNIRIVRLFGNRLFLQTGHWMTALKVDSLVVDLDPRSLTAWIFLATRRLLRRRTLVWVHLYPQAGRASKSAWLRLLMRKIASGAILYTYKNVQEASIHMPTKSVWVAPNALFDRADIARSPYMAASNDVIYVGRFEPAKKLDLLIRGFALFSEYNSVSTLLLIGDGSQAEQLRQLICNLGIANRVRFLGWIDEVHALKEIYSTEYCSVPPGFAGLGFSQSLGFGVPMAVARDEPHSPEIELPGSGGVTWFESNDAESLSKTLEIRWNEDQRHSSAHLVKYVAERYPAEAMASGIHLALTSQPQKQTRGAL